MTQLESYSHQMLLNISDLLDENTLDYSHSMFLSGVHENKFEISMFY